jgi:hypothetical protein
MLTGATVGVKGYVLEMADRVVKRAGVHVGVVISGYRPGARTVNGSLSLHATRNAVDIGARGATLIRLGQAALAEAGGNANLRSFAGTVNGWEIIFNSNEPGYGDHFDHLHLGWEGAGVPKGASGGYSPQAQYGFTELMGLWLEAGGAREHAAMAAQVASYESGGRPAAHAHTTREDSRGLWQINIKSNAHPEYAHANLYDPMVNAQAAIAISRNGTQWSQWSTAAAARARLATRSAAEKTPPNVSRPGGEKKSGGGLFPGVGSFLTGLPGGNILFGSGPGGVQGNIADTAWTSAQTFMHLVTFVIDPKNWLRLVEFLFGFALIMLGLGVLVVEFSKRDTATGKAAGGIVNIAKRFTPTGRLASTFKSSRRYSGGRPPRRERISQEPTPVYRKPSSQNAGDGGGIPF